MSFILDALRKSELERQRQSGPTIAELPVARQDRRLPVALVAVGILLVVNAAVLLYFLLRDDAAPAAAAPAAAVAAAPAAAPAPQAPMAAPGTSPLSAMPADAAAPDPMPGAPATEAPEAPDPTLLPEAPRATPGDGTVRYDSPAPPALDTLPPQATAGLAELSVDLHIYSTDPARRAVFINGRRYTEGMALAEGPMVEEINRDGVVINHRGQRFLLPRN